MRDFLYFLAIFMDFSTLIGFNDDSPELTDWLNGWLWIRLDADNKHFELDSLYFDVMCVFGTGKVQISGANIIQIFLCFSDFYIFGTWYKTITTRLLIFFWFYDWIKKCVADKFGVSFTPFPENKFSQFPKYMTKIRLKLWRSANKRWIHKKLVYDRLVVKSTVDSFAVKSCSMHVLWS